MSMTYEDAVARRQANAAPGNSNTAWMATASPYNDVNAVNAPTNTVPGPERMRATLSQYGLEAMSDRAWAYVQASSPSEAEFAYWLRQQPEYQARFPGMAELSKQGRALSEAEYINLERAYVSLYRQAGLPEGFYDDPSDFGRLIAGNVSPAELQGRLDFYTRITYKLPPIVRDEMKRQFGLTDGDITAFIIDEKRALPILELQVGQAEVGAGSRLAGFGLLSNDEAARLSQGGVGFEQAVQGFGQLVDATQLFNPLIGDQGEDAITRDEQLGAVFEGNAIARRKFQERARKRAAEFESGGRYSGFGSAST